MKKYIVHAGYVKSKNDGQLHYITEIQLIRLYNVPLSECLSSKNTRGITNWSDDINLFPRDDGNYNKIK